MKELLRGEAREDRSVLLQQIVADGIDVPDKVVSHAEAFLDTRPGPYSATYRRIGQPLAGLALAEELHELQAVEPLARALAARLNEQTY